MTELHDRLVAVHAVSAVVALLAGLVVLPTGRLLALHVVALLTTTGSLAGAVVVGFPDLDAVTRVVFAGLVVLAAAMCVTAMRVWRAWRGRRGLPSRTPDVVHVDRTGFVLISLVVGFVLVAVLRSGAPAWLGVLSGAATVAGGRVVVHAVRRRVVRPG